MCVCVWQNWLLKVCYVHTTRAHLPRLLFYFSAAAINSTNDIYIYIYYARDCWISSDVTLCVPSCSTARVRIAQPIYYGLDAFPHNVTGRCMQLLHGLSYVLILSQIYLYLHLLCRIWSTKINLGRELNKTNSNLSMRLCHPPDGSSSPKYKLVHLKPP
jgi:hypothetical protein